MTSGDIYMVNIPAVKEITIAASISQKFVCFSRHAQSSV